MNAIFNNLNPQYYGIIFLTAGVLIRFAIANRRFKRRGVGGLQHFKVPFALALLIVLIELLLTTVAYAMIITGIFMMIKW